MKVALVSYRYPSRLSPQRTKIWLEIELSEVMGRKVDLRTPAELSRYFRDEVSRTGEVQYAPE